MPKRIKGKKKLKPEKVLRKGEILEELKGISYGDQAETEYIVSFDEYIVSFDGDYYSIIYNNDDNMIEAISRIRIDTKNKKDLPEAVQKDLNERNDIVKLKSTKFISRTFKLKIKK